MVCFCVTLQIHHLLTKNTYFSSVLFLELMFKMQHVSKYNQNWYFWPRRLKSITSWQADLPIYAYCQTPFAPLWLFGTSDLEVCESWTQSCMHKGTEGFLQRCVPLMFWGPFSWQCSPESLKPGVSKGLCCSNEHLNCISQGTFSLHPGHEQQVSM